VILFCYSAQVRFWHKADSETIYCLRFRDKADIADQKFGRDGVAKISRFKNLALTMLPKERAGV
jgi:hypothetical protein